MKLKNIIIKPIFSKKSDKKRIKKDIKLFIRNYEIIGKGTLIAEYIEKRELYKEFSEKESNKEIIIIYPENSKKDYINKINNRNVKSNFGVWFIDYFETIIENSVFGVSKKTIKK